jgi:CDP-diacylglycerol--glycerol-3-phosphate 3-phosphatidyltransferase
MPYGTEAWLGKLSVHTLNTICDSKKVVGAGPTDGRSRIGNFAGLLGQINIACWVTILRFAALPVVVLPVYLQWPHGFLIAAIACGLGGLSDGLDGYLARRCGCATSFGGSLDLLADKLFVAVVMLLLVLQGIIPYWMLVLVLLREIGVTVLRNRSKQLVLRPDRLGKTKTGITIAALTGLLLRQEFLQEGLLAIFNVTLPVSQVLALAPWLMLLAVVLTVLSGVNYFFRYLEARKAGDKLSKGIA